MWLIFAFPVLLFLVDSVLAQVCKRKIIFIRWCMFHRCLCSDFRQQQGGSAHNKPERFLPSVFAGLHQISACILLSEEHFLPARGNVFSLEAFFRLEGNRWSAFVQSLCKAGECVCGAAAPNQLFQSTLLEYLAPHIHHPSKADNFQKAVFLSWPRD